MNKHFTLISTIVDKDQDKIINNYDLIGSDYLSWQCGNDNLKVRKRSGSNSAVVD